MPVFPQTLADSGDLSLGWTEGSGSKSDTDYESLRAMNAARNAYARSQAPAHTVNNTDATTEEHSTDTDTDTDTDANTDTDTDAGTDPLSETETTAAAFMAAAGETDTDMAEEEWVLCEESTPPGCATPRAVGNTTAAADETCSTLTEDNRRHHSSSTHSHVAQGTFDALRSFCGETDTDSAGSEDEMCDMAGPDTAADDVPALIHEATEGRAGEADVSSEVVEEEQRNEVGQQYIRDVCAAAAKAFKALSNTTNSEQREPSSNSDSSGSGEGKNGRRGRVTLELPFTAPPRPTAATTTTTTNSSSRGGMDVWGGWDALTPAPHSHTDDDTWSAGSMPALTSSLPPGYEDEEWVAGSEVAGNDAASRIGDVESWVEALECSQGDLKVCVSVGE